MGAGYYLKATNRYSTGWKIEKDRKWSDNWDESLYISIAERCVFEDKQETPQDTPDATEPETATTTPNQPENAPQDTPDDKPAATIGDYKGNATISLPMGSRGFTFGKAKARAILEYVDEIRDFVDNN